MTSVLRQVHPLVRWNTILASALWIVGSAAASVEVAHAQRHPTHVDGTPFHAHPLVISDAPYMDDGAFVVSAESRGSGWVPRLRFVLWGAIEDGDRMRVVLKQGRRTVADFDCPLRSRYAADADARSREQRCTPDDVELTQTGDLQGEITYVTRMDQAREGFHSFSARVQRFGGGRGEQAVYSVLPTDTGAMAWLEFATARDEGVLLRPSIVFWRQVGDDDLPDLRLLCTVDGQPIDWGGAITESTVYSVTFHTSATEERTLQLVAIQFGGGRYGETYDWMRNHPGRWECTASAGRRVLRVVRFTVEAAGIPYHAAQTDPQSPLRLHPMAVLVEVDPSRTSPGEESSDPRASARTTMFGQAWPGPGATWFTGAASPGAAPRRGGRGR